MNYDFQILSPFEFEILTRDLIQKVFNMNFETFGSGKDDGIDLRCSKSNNIIVQCKRYKDFKSLYQNLKKELPKVQKLKPDRYLVSTSCSLLPAQKDKILELFHPYIQNTADIYGKEDLNNLISQYPEIEKRHYKLWLSSVNVLQSIISSQVLNQSKFVKDEIFEKVSVYVQNQSFAEAMEILKTNKYVIISGNPGIGKTTLAEILIYHLLANGIEQFIFLSDSISQAYEHYSEDKSQIFLFDDFLGRNFLQNKLPTNEEKQIVRFIERIEKSKNKFLVFTTREYILNQATEKYEDFQSKDFSKCILDVGKYSTLVKAEILYNHLHINSIPFDFVQSLVANNKIFEVINHTNYNPRIIESFTKSKLWEKCSPSKFPDLVLDLFNNPYLVWKHAFETQISELGRIILLNLTITGNEIEYHSLYDQIRFYFIRNSDHVNFKLNNYSFKSSLKELENSFIKITKKHESYLVIGFQNPSIQDFLVDHISQDKITRRTILNSIQYVQNALSKISLKDKNKLAIKQILIDEDEMADLKQYLISNFDQLAYKSDFTVYSKPNDIDDFILTLSMCFFRINNFDREFTKAKFASIINSDRVTWHSISDFTYLLENFHDEVEVDPLELFRNLSGSFASYDELSSLKTIKAIYPDEFDIFREDYEDEFSDLFYDIIYEIKSEEFTEEYECNEIVDKLNSIESDFEYDTYSERIEVEEKMEEIKAKQREQDAMDKAAEDEKFMRYMYYLDHHDKDLRAENRKNEQITTTTSSSSSSSSSSENSEPYVAPVEPPVVSDEQRIQNLFGSLE